VQSSRDRGFAWATEVPSRFGPWRHPEIVVGSQRRLGVGRGVRRHVVATVPSHGDAVRKRPAEVSETRDAAADHRRRGAGERSGHESDQRRARGAVPAAGLDLGIDQAGAPNRVDGVHDAAAARQVADHARAKTTATVAALAVVPTTGVTGLGAKPRHSHLTHAHGAGALWRGVQASDSTTRPAVEVEGPVHPRPGEGSQVVRAPAIAVVRATVVPAEIAAADPTCDRAMPLKPAENEGANVRRHVTAAPGA
jgi:hypothetical protein